MTTAQAIEEDRGRLEIRKLIQAYIDVIFRKDAAASMSCYATDVVAFDMMPPLRHVGAAELSKAWELGFSMTDGPFKVELRDLVIVASGDVGSAHALQHVDLKATDGTHVDMWSRWTAGFRKLGGAWKIAHEQTSVPIDMERQKPLWDLKP